KQLIRFTELRRKGIRKAEKAALFLPEQSDLAAFWEILTRNLSEKYATHPVHTLSEMAYLRQRFPENILLYTVASEEEVLAGVVIYLCDQVAHVQYISASEKGKQLGALDYLFSTLILERYSAVEYFDFGSSTENMGLMLNEALLFQKEGFGGRGIIYPIYELQIGAEKTT
ncbi:MAG: GNAT family N-acetyltransferase, partial [Bacteroidales bacterium]